MEINLKKSGYNRLNLHVVPSIETAAIILESLDFFMQ